MQLFSATSWGYLQVVFDRAHSVFSRVEILELVSRKRHFKLQVCCHWFWGLHAAVFFIRASDVWKEN